MDFTTDNTKKLDTVLLNKIGDIGSRLVLMDEGESTRKMLGQTISSLIKGAELLLEFVAAEDEEDLNRRVDNIIRELMEDKDKKGLRIAGVRDYFQIDYIGPDDLRTTIETFVDRQKAIDAMSLLQMAERCIDRDGHYELDRYIVLDVNPSFGLAFSGLGHHDILVESNITGWRAPSSKRRSYE